MQMYVLPENGRQYGFPKIYSEEMPLCDWLVQEGYPRELIHKDMDISTWDIWPDNPVDSHAI